MLSEREVLAALGGARPAPAAASMAETPDTGEIAPEVDRCAIEQALQQVGGNRSAAARKLGISRRALYRRLDAFGLR
jgi:two-component system response regulator AtoC